MRGIVGVLLGVLLLLLFLDKTQAGRIMLGQLKLWSWSSGLTQKPATSGIGPFASGTQYASALADLVTGKTGEVPGTGHTWAELNSIGYTDTQIRGIIAGATEVPGTGHSIDELMGLGYSLEQIKQIVS